MRGARQPQNGPKTAPERLLSPQVVDRKVDWQRWKQESKAGAGQGLGVPALGSRR